MQGKPLNILSALQPSTK